MFDRPRDPRRTCTQAQPRDVFSRRLLNIVILDRHLRVEMHGATDIWQAHGVEPVSGELIGEPVCALLLEATAEWGDGIESCDPLVAMPWSDIVMRAYPLASPIGVKIAVSAERFRARTNLAWARHAFALSPRETEIVEFLLRGYPTPIIAEHMHIAESTAADHIKRLLDKTRSNNRAELVAKLLGWRSSEEAPPVP